MSSINRLDRRMRVGYGLTRCAVREIARAGHRTGFGQLQTLDLIG